MEVIEVAGKLLGLAVADFGGGESGSDDEDACWSRTDSGASYEGGGSDDENSINGKRKRMSAEDRKARNRERNRLHARKTRQRKKQHVQELQLKIWGLRQERQRLLQLSTDHRTAGVLLALSCSPERCVQEVGGLGQGFSRSPSVQAAPTSTRDWSRELACHEETLRKITQEFESMDGGQPACEDGCGGIGEDSGSGGRSGGGSGAGSAGNGGGSPRGGGGKGTLADRTALRRERNRMHAKRTRNRKKLFVEACSVMIDKMKVENAQLEAEIRATGIPLPPGPYNTAGAPEMLPEEPLPEYLAALWEFAEGKRQGTRPSPTVSAPLEPTAPMSHRPLVLQARRTPSLSTTSSDVSASVGSTMTPPMTSSTPLSPERASSTPGQALEDAGKLCAFMEAAQRSVKRTRVVSMDNEGKGGSNGGGDVVRPRIWSDHGSTTSESRGSSESGDEAASEQREAADAALLLASRGTRRSGDSSMSSSPALWTSRLVLERYVLAREVF